MITGEIELRHADIGGIAVNMAARVMSAAFDGEIWVTSTVPGLVAGSGHQFSDRGVDELKGIPGSWTLAAGN
jgi:class 3 adenylate cyclase